VNAVDQLLSLWICKSGHGLSSAAAAVIVDDNDERCDCGNCASLGGLARHVRHKSPATTRV